MEELDMAGIITIARGIRSLHHAHVSGNCNASIQSKV